MEVTGRKLDITESGGSHRVAESSFPVSLWQKLRSDRALWLLGGSLLVGAALRLWLAFNDDGIYWPDEIYQSLEPAHRLVFGYGLVAWEFIDGARNWALPGLVAAVMKLASIFSSEPRGYLGAVRVFFCAISLATAVGIFRLARAFEASTFSSAVGAALFLGGAPFIYFAPRAMSETASALPVVIGLALLQPKDARLRTQVLGAALLGLAVFLRLHSAVFCAGAFVMLAAQRRWRAALGVGATFAVAAILFGLLDRLTWGSWFHSAIKYLEFNVVEGRSAQWGTAAFTYYARVLWTALGPAWPVSVALACLAWKRAPGLLGMAVAFFALHSLVPHKELRFLLPALPVLFAAAAVGLDTLKSPAFSPAAAVTLLSVAYSAITFHSLTFGDLGQYEDSKPLASAYDDFGAVNRLLLAARHRADLCGINIEPVHLAWTGGATYLHKNVPIYWRGQPPRDSGFYNYVLTVNAWARGGTVVASQGPFALMRLPFDGCRPDPGYQWRLP